MSAAQEISAYENVAAMTGRMRLAAQRGEWDHLAALEQACSKLVASLRGAQMQPVLPEFYRRRKLELLRQMLVDDAEIRRLTEPWLEELKGFIDSTGKSRSLSRAYGVGDPAPRARRDANAG